jgi:hypothetical protein
MRKLILSLALLLLAMPLMAGDGMETNAPNTRQQGNPVENLRSGLGDVIVLLNGGANEAYIGDTNTVEVWIKNDAPLTAINLWLEFIIGRNYQFDPNYGSSGYSNPEGDVQNYLDLHAENAEINNWSPDTLEFGSADMFPPGFPAHTSHTLSYTMQIYIEPNQSELADGLCINCTTNPAHWYFAEEGITYRPTFNGYPHTSAPPLCFDIVEHSTPSICGDVNCDDVCNVSDAVWIINYVFVGGNVPCDSSGDGIPDC